MKLNHLYDWSMMQHFPIVDRKFGLRIDIGTHTRYTNHTSMGPKQL